MVHAVLGVVLITLVLFVVVWLTGRVTLGE